MFLSPLIATHLFFDLCFIMPIYLALFSYGREYHNGTLSTCIFFNLLSKLLQLLVKVLTFLLLIDIVLQVLNYLICSVVCLVISADINELFVQDSAFFSIFVTDLLLAMFNNPNKPVDLLCVTVAQKYFTVIMLFFGHFMLPYDWISIVTVLLVSLTLHAIRKIDILSQICSRIERMLSCGRGCQVTLFGYITLDQAKQNEAQSTDHLVPFDRRTIRGHVRNNPAYQQHLRFA